MVHVQIQAFDDKGRVIYGRDNSSEMMYIFDSIGQIPSEIETLRIEYPYAVRFKVDIAV